MFRNSCKDVQRTKKKKKLIPKSTNYFLNQSTFEWYWTVCGSEKDTYVFISLFTWTFTVLQTSMEAGPARVKDLWGCVFWEGFYHRGCCQNKSRASGPQRCCIFIQGESGGGCGRIPPLPAGSRVTWDAPLVCPHALWPVVCLQMGQHQRMGGRGRLGGDVSLTY